MLAYEGYWWARPDSNRQRWDYDGPAHPLSYRTIDCPGSFRTGIEQRTRFSGKPIDAYESTSGALRKIMDTVSADMFPGEPARAARAIYDVVTSPGSRHWIILGSDAHRRIGVKLDLLRAEFEAGKDLAWSTDYPGAGEAIL